MCRVQSQSIRCVHFASLLFSWRLYFPGAPSSAKGCGVLDRQFHPESHPVRGGHHAVVVVTTHQLHKAPVRCYAQEQRVAFGGMEAESEQKVSGSQMHFGGPAGARSRQPPAGGCGRERPGAVRWRGGCSGRRLPGEAASVVQTERADQSHFIAHVSGRPCHRQPSVFRAQCQRVRAGAQVQVTALVTTQGNVSDVSLLFTPLNQRGAPAWWPCPASPPPLSGWSLPRRAAAPAKAAQ